MLKKITWCLGNSNSYVTRYTENLGDKFRHVGHRWDTMKITAMDKEPMYAPSAGTLGTSW